MEATLKIYSVIGTDENQFSSDHLISFLDSNKEATDLTIRIKSPGGSVREGWTIYDMLKQSGKNVKTIAEGELYSIATVIFLAGSEREIFPNADGLIHMPRIPNPEGDFQAADLREMAIYMDQEEAKIINLYAEVTGKDEATLREYMTKETMLSAQDMLTLGFATKITEPIKAVAYFNYKSNKMEKDEVKTFGEKLDALGESIKALFSRLPATDQTMTDKDGKEFKLEKESGAPAVGDKASPDGTFVMADGKTVVISSGAVTAVDDAVEDKTELEIANEKIADLTKQLDEEKAKIVDAEKVKSDAVAAEASFKEKEAKAVALVTELTALKNTWRPDGRRKFSSVEKVGDVNLDAVREFIKNKKDK
jgi:ATP-dependent Clp protease protease subunit